MVHVLGWAVPRKADDIHDLQIKPHDPNRESDVVGGMRQSKLGDPRKDTTLSVPKLFEDEVAVDRIDKTPSPKYIL